MWTTRKRSCFLGPRGRATQTLIGVIRSAAANNLLRRLLITVGTTMCELKAVGMIV